ERRRHPARPDLAPHERGRLGFGAQGAFVRHLLRLARGGDALSRAGVGRLRAFHLDVRAGRQLRPGELRGRQARHRRAVEVDRPRHAALQRALQLRIALCLEPDDRHVADRDRGGEAPRRALAAHDAGENRAGRGLSAQRRGKGRDRADFRRAHERDHADGPVAAGALRAAGRRLDPGDAHRARHAGAQGLVLSAAALAGSLQLGPGVMTAGIVAFGAYIPRLRLTRRAIAEANAWFNPALNAQAKGERAICNWDEDAVTMAVEAARDALAERDRGTIGALQFASTSFPFADRLNAGIVAEALNLNKEVAALDVAASQRAGTSALIAASRGGGRTLVVAADKRRTRSASPLEMSVGDGAAAILVGEGEPAARLIGAASHTADFIDHYRGEDTAFDYQWEERWIRDAGYLKIVPPA